MRKLVIALILLFTTAQTGFTEVPFRILRSIANPSQYKSAGYIDFTGTFDPEVYEQVEGKPSDLDALELEPPPIPLNQQLENAFLAMLPEHLGQPYLTRTVIREILEAKQAITDANRLGMPGIAKQIVEDLTLPAEMEADRQSLLSLFP